MATTEGKARAAVQATGARRASPRTGAFLMRRHNAGGVDTAVEDPAALAAALEQQGAGEALPLALRLDLERRFGVDFSRVRVHTGPTAAQAARAIGARAFTANHDIFFAAGEFSPTAAVASPLLLHELAHVVQVQQGRVPAAPAVGVRMSHVDDALERDAQRLANAADRTPRGAAEAPAAAVPAMPPARSTADAPAVMRWGKEPIVSERDELRLEQSPSRGEAVLSYKGEAFVDLRWQALEGRRIDHFGLRRGIRSAPSTRGDIATFEVGLKAGFDVGTTVDGVAEQRVVSSMLRAQTEFTHRFEFRGTVTYRGTDGASRKLPSPAEFGYRYAALSSADSSPGQTPEAIDAEADRRVLVGAPRPPPSPAAPTNEQSAKAAAKTKATAEAASPHRSLKDVLLGWARGVVKALTGHEALEDAKASKSQPATLAGSAARARSADGTPKEMASDARADADPHESRGARKHAARDAVVAVPGKGAAPPAKPGSGPRGRAHVGGKRGAGGAAPGGLTSTAAAPAAVVGQQAPVAPPDPTEDRIAASQPDALRQDDEAGGMGEPVQPTEAVAEPAAASDDAGPAVADAEPPADAATDAAGQAVPGSPSIRSADVAPVPPAMDAAGAMQSPSSEAAATEPPAALDAAPARGDQPGPAEEASADAAPGTQDATLSGAERSAALHSLGEELPPESGGEGAADVGGGDSTGGGDVGGAGTKSEQAVPAVSAMPPEQGLATLASATPAQAEAALGGVQGAAASDGASTLAAVQDALPQATLGEPVRAETSAPPRPGPKGRGAAAAKLHKPAAAHARPGKARLKPTPTPPVGNAADKVARPQLPKLAEGAEPSAADRARLASSISALPTTDPSLRLRLGDVPTLQLSGDSDPAHVAAQQAQSRADVAAARARDAAEVAAPMGEADVRPTTGRVEIKARALQPVGRAGRGAAAGGGGPGTARARGGGGAARGLLAEEMKGAEVRAAMSAASTQVGSAKTELNARVAAAQVETGKQVAALKTQTAADQDAARAKVRADAQTYRDQYAQQQENAVAKLDATQQGTVARAVDQVADEKKKGEDAAAEQIEQGNTQVAAKQGEVEGAIQQKKREAEAAAADKGFFGRLADDVGAWFDKQKKWISDKVEAGKKWISEAAERFKKFAAAKIDAARDRITGLIKDAGALLVKATDRLLADFPAARDAVRGRLQAGVDWGVKRVNQVAELAKKAADKLVDAAATLAQGALGLAGKAINAAIDYAKTTTVAALNTAEQAAQALGALAVLVEDIAADPGAWIRKLGAAAKDGVKNHLITAMKDAIKAWWEGKIESVLGVGMAIWQLLKKGGLGLKEIGAMAWSAIKAALPPALIRLVIEKLVAMIIPAAGAILAIIEGLQAAWGSVSAILGAINKAIVFLKAVKSGNAGRQFAALIAAAAIVVIDFVSNWLLAKLGKAIMKIAGKIMAIAQRLMKKVGKFFKKIKTKWKAWRRRRARRKGRKGQRATSKSKARKKKVKDNEAAKRRRLDAAVAAIRPKLQATLKKGVSRLRLGLQLLVWRLQHRLSQLTLRGQEIVAKVNPEATLDTVDSLDLGITLEPILQAAEARFMDLYDQSRAADDLLADPREGNAGYVERSTRLDDIRTIRGLTTREGMAPARMGGHQIRLSSTGVTLSVSDVASLASGVIPMGRHASYASLDKHWQTVGAPEVSGVGPGHRSLMLLERARHKGMLPAMDVVEAMAQRGAVTTQEMVTGALNPMRKQGAGMAGTIDSFNEGVSHRPLGRKERDQVAEGRLSRRRAVGDIFKRLHREARTEKGVLVRGGEANKPLHELAEAVEKWFEAREKANQGNSDAKWQEATHREALILQFVVFLKSFRG